MRKAIFKDYSPLVKLIFLLILSIASLSVFLFFAGIIVRLLWGFNFIDNPSALENFNDPFVVDANRLMLVFQQIGFFIFPAIVFLKLTTNNPKSFVLWRNNISALVSITVIALLLSFMPVINLFIQLNETMVFPEFMAGIEAAFRSMEDAAMVLTEALIKMDSISDFLYMVLLIAILPAIGEELMFRGIIQRLLTVQFKNYHWGIWGSAFLFSAIHFQFYGFLPRMLLGALFGYMLVYTGNIIYPMVAHFFNNLVSLVLAYLIQHGKIPEDIDTIGANLEWQFILPGLIVSAILFHYLRKNRNPELIKQYQILPQDDIEDDYIGVT
jgi:membrane protease YdiL (CAAX protease family)